MRKVLALVLAMALMMPWAWAAEKESIVIGMALNRSDDAMLIQKDCLQEYVNAYNAASDKYDVRFYFTNAEDDVQKQIDDINALIELGCQAICIHSIDLEACKVAVDACKAAGILVMESRGMVHDGIDLSYTSNDESEIARAAFTWFEEIMDAQPQRQLKIGAIYGMATQTAQLVRVDRLIQLLQDKYPDRVSVVDSAFCDWDQQKSMEIMENWLQKYPPQEMNCIINASGAGQCGCAQAIIGFGGLELLDQYILQTTSANTQVMYNVYEGLVDMTVSINPYAAGYITGEVLIQMVTGEPGPHNFDLRSGELRLGIEDGGINCVDETNVKDWYDPQTNQIIYPPMLF